MGMGVGVGGEWTSFSASLGGTELFVCLLLFLVVVVLFLFLIFFNQLQFRCTEFVTQPTVTLS